MKPEVKMDDLAPQFFIGMSAKTHPGARERHLETCLRAGFEGRILQEADCELSALKFVADGLGVALMPDVVFRPLSPPLLRESSIA